MAKKYQQLESKTLSVSEPYVEYGSLHSRSLADAKSRNIEHAISGEELMSRLRPRIKALFK